MNLNHPIILKRPPHKGQFKTGNKYSVGFGRPKQTYCADKPHYPSPPELTAIMSVTQKQLAMDFRKMQRGEFAASRRIYMYAYAMCWHARRAKAARRALKLRYHPHYIGPEVAVPDDMPAATPIPPGLDAPLS